MDTNKPQGLKIRREIQELITDSIPDKKFNINDIDLVMLDIELKNLGEEFEGYEIVNLSDIHLGQWINPDYLSDVVDYVNSLNSDLITLTGDYVSYVIDGYEKILEQSFKRLKANDAKLGVLGNHDHWMGAEKIQNIFKKSGISDLSNDVYNICKKDSTLSIAGVDSCTVCADNLDIVLEKLPQNTPSILLSHEPDFALQSSKTGRFDLQISGHSHGGQFIIPKFETTPFRGPNSRKYPVGLYKVGDMIQYTSKGLGTNSFRMRINCKPEITLITLRRKT